MTEPSCDQSAMSSTMKEDLDPVHNTQAADEYPHLGDESKEDPNFQMLLLADKESLTQRVKSLEMENMSLRNKLFAAESSRGQEFGQTLTNFLPQFISAVNNSIPRPSEDHSSLMIEIRKELDSINQNVHRTVIESSNELKSQVMTQLASYSPASEDSLSCIDVIDRVDSHFQDLTKQQSSIISSVKELFKEVSVSKLPPTVVSDRNPQDQLPTSIPFGSYVDQRIQYANVDNPNHRTTVNDARIKPEVVVVNDYRQPPNVQPPVRQFAQPPLRQMSQPPIRHPVPPPSRNSVQQVAINSSLGQPSYEHGLEVSRIHPVGPPVEKRARTTRDSCLRCNSNHHSTDSCHHMFTMCYQCKGLGHPDSVARGHAKLIHKEIDMSRRSKIISLLGITGFEDWLNFK